MDPHIMQRKDQEFIDHTLLAPEYMRHSNHSWIPMDLMNFSKPTNHDSVGTLSTDLHYNSLFPETSEQHSADVERKEISGVYIPINSDFLIQKSFNNSIDQVDPVEENGVKVVQQLLMSETNVALSIECVDEDCDIPPFQKVLPHKKRISRKLKINCDTELPYEEQKLPNVEHLEGEDVQQFRCELCGHVTCSQLQFFAHLKQHYEPSTPDTILAAMKTSLDVLGPEKTDESSELCTTHKKTSGINQAFFPFENFAQNSDNAQVVRAAELKMINTPLDGIINYSRSLKPRLTPPNSSTPHNLEPEFSDTEDMLEGIRDKVLIEDTCDTMDLMTPTINGTRPHWFTNNCIPNVDLKPKPFCDVLFTSNFASLPLNVPAHSDDNNADIILSNSMNDSTIEQQTHLKQPLPKLTPALIRFGSEGETGISSSLSPPPLTHNKHMHYDQLHSSNTSFYTPSLLSANGQVSCAEPVNHKLLPQTQENKVNEGSHTLPIFSIKVEEVSIQQSKSPIYFNADETMSEDGLEHDQDVTDEQHYKKNNLDQCKQTKSVMEFDEKGPGCGQTDVKLKTSNTKVGRKRYQCNNCHRVFNSCNALKYHFQTHTGQRTHHCEICGKSFFAQGALKAHTRTHTGDKPYECTVCSRKFRQWGDLKYHVTSIHSNEKNHQCEFCGKAFSRKYSLVVHLRIHTSERNYKCEFCTRTFRASSYLQNHRKIHTGEKPYECKICSKKFRTSGDLRRHQRTHERKRHKQSFVDNVLNSIKPPAIAHTPMAIKVSLS